MQTKWARLQDENIAIGGYSTKEDAELDRLEGEVIIEIGDPMDFDFDFNPNDYYIELNAPPY